MFKPHSICKLECSDMNVIFGFRCIVLVFFLNNYCDVLLRVIIYA